jgi:pilus assembly protein CpaC
LGANSGAVPAGVTKGSDPKEPNLASGGIGNPLSGIPAVFGLSDLLNVFLFRPDLNLGATIRALQQRNLLQMLAEPNILARNGTEANFLAGGEFPFPILQGGAIQSVTIVFKEFGVRLKFLPTIQPNGTIRLKVQPEVSSLDFSNALTVSGFLIPALSTRRVDTEVELRDGQSFAIAGLIDNRTREVGSKIPVLGDLPIIGNLFKSKAERKDNTELLVIVTPKLVTPLDAAQVPNLPLPKPFLDKEKFDGKTGVVPPK